MDIKCLAYSILYWIDKKTWQLPKLAPQFNRYCKEGVVKLSNIQKLPEELLELYISQEPHAIKF
jgi:hypothetical protein